MRELVVSLHPVLFLNLFFWLITSRRGNAVPLAVKEILEKLTLCYLEGCWDGALQGPEVLSHFVTRGHFETPGCILWETNRWFVFSEYHGPAIEK